MKHGPLAEETLKSVARKFCGCVGETGSEKVLSRQEAHAVHETIKHNVERTQAYETG
jgi:hypothetical protein